MDEAEQSVCAVDGRDEGVGVGLVVRHARCLQEEGYDVEAEGRRPETEGVGEDLDARAEGENGAEGEVAD